MRLLHYQAEFFITEPPGQPSSHYAAAAKLLQSCLTLHDPIDGSPRGSPVPGILQARTLEWVAISFSNAWKWKVKVKSLSRVWLLVTPWTAACRLLHPWDFPGKSTRVGCHCLTSIKKKKDCSQREKNKNKDHWSYITITNIIMKKFEIWQELSKCKSDQKLLKKKWCQ